MPNFARTIHVCWLALALSCKDGAPTTVEEATPVRVRTLASAGVGSAASYSATTEAFTRVDLDFKVGGYVDDVLMVPGGADHKPRKLQEGDFVKKGTVLAVVRQNDYQARLAQAQGVLEESIANQTKAQIDYERSAKLFEERTTTKSEVDTNKAALEVATARVVEARASVAQSAISLSDCTLRAPMDGIVIKRNVEVGALVNTGSLAFIVGDTSIMKVIFGAPDAVVERLKIGDAVNISFSALPGNTYAAKLTRLAPSADQRSRTFDVEAQIPNPKGDVRVGMIAFVSLGAPASTSPAARVLLPLTSVVRSPHDPRGFAVFVTQGTEESTTVQIHDVQVGDVVGNSLLVENDLKVGDRVVTTGATLIKDGSHVRVIP